MVEMGQPDVSPKNRKLVAAFIHNCIEWRVDYIKELMEYVHVDQWGDCLKNTPGEFYKTRHGPYSRTKVDFLKKNPYKFVLSFKIPWILITFQKKCMMLICHIPSLSSMVTEQCLI